MSDSVVVLLLRAGLRVAMAPRPAGSLPSVCAPLGNLPSGSASAPYFCPWNHLLQLAATPPHRLDARGLPSQHGANLLVKRPRFD
jgi:hypothetical protein